MAEPLDREVYDYEGELEMLPTSTPVRRICFNLLNLLFHDQCGNDRTPPRAFPAKAISHYDLDELRAARPDGPITEPHPLRQYQSKARDSRAHVRTHSPNLHALAHTKEDLLDIAKEEIRDNNLFN